ncbi:GGDEF domain-containing protein [Geodermatophilus sp. SYSU D00691]
MSRRDLRPRHERAAALASAVLFGASAALLVAYLALDPTEASEAVVVQAWAQVVALVVFGAVSWLARGRLTRCGMWPVLSAVGVLAVAHFMLMFPGQALMAHALLTFPVVWAASQMRAPVAAGVTGFAAVVDALTLLLLEPVTLALIHWLYVAPVLVVVAVVLVQAMNRQDRLIAALREQATVDPLTGLVTRRVLHEALEHTLVTAPRVEGSALLLVDVDKFKHVNDSHGHPVGDDVLVHLAAVLTTQVRAGDAVISRLGGDELAVLLPGCSAEAAAGRGEQLVDAVRATPLLLPDGTLLALSVSIGVAHTPSHAAPDGLYAAADAALYRAKRAGRNRAAIAATHR